MAIVKMNKFTLLTFESKKKELLRQLQGFSKVEFINLQDEQILEKYEELSGLSGEQVDSEYVECEENLSKTKFALDFLGKYTPKKSMIQQLREEKKALTIEELEKNAEESKWQLIVEKVEKREKEIHQLESEITKLEGEIEVLLPWQSLDASFDSLQELRSVSFFLGSISKQYEEDVTKSLENVYLEIISRTPNEVNLLVIVNKENEDGVSEILRSCGFSSFKTETEGVPVSVITDSKAKIEELKSKIFFVKEELASYDEEENILELAFEYFTNKMLRMKSVNNFLNISSVVAIQGWISVENNDKLNVLCKKCLGDDYYIEYEEVKEDEIDYVPIELKNGDMVSAFESVTGMYSFPKYNEIDPTPLLAPFYFIFFGMMVADAGYGLVVLLASALALKFFKLDDIKKDFAKFFLYLSVPTIFFGLIYGSFFGDLIKLPTQIIDTNTDVNTILALSLILGVVQIFFGLGIKAYMLIKIGKPKDAFYDVGSWIITLVSIGGIAAVKFMKLPNIVSTIFICTMVFGMILIVLTGGRGEKTNGAKIGQGLYSLYGITGYVGDLVSYTRLMALGLAGGSIAGALNLLISTMPGIAAVLVAPILFVLAHIFNLGLSLLGAYVHTARLQYVEYFSKFYDGGGRAFNAFKASEQYINIKRD